MAPFLVPATTQFLEAGSALLVGTTATDGAPVAARGWGCRVVDVGPTTATLRVLLAADDPSGMAHTEVGDRVAVTATSVRTLHSMQLKGRIVAMEPGDPDDERTSAAYCDAFFTDIIETDGTPLTILRRMVPNGQVAWTVEVDELYDQTPGPAAGTPLTGAPA